MNHDHGISIYKSLQTDEDSRARRASGNNTSAAMERSDRLTLILLLVSLQAVCCPVDAWYKQAARPNYYSVGRASGLLSGIRKSEPELEPIDPLKDINALPETHFPRNFLKNMVRLLQQLICVSLESKC